MLFAERYFGKPSPDEFREGKTSYITGPFRSDAEHLAAWMTFVDMLCAMSLYETDEQLSDRRRRIGTLQNELDADELAAPPGAVYYRRKKDTPESLRESRNAAEDAAEAADAALSAETGKAGAEEPEIRELEQALPLAEKQAARDVFADLLESGYDPQGRPVDALSALFLKLEPLEIFASVLALCATENRKYERLFSLLSEERQGVVRPTVGLCMDLARFFLSKSERDLSLFMNRDSFFSKYVLIYDDATWDSQLSHPLALQPETLAFVTGGTLVSSRAAFFERLDSTVGQPCVREKAKDELIRLIRRVEDRLMEQPLSGPFALLLSAEAGAGKRFVLRAAAEAFGMGILSVDASLLAGMTESRREEGLSSVLRASLLENAFVYLHHLPEEEDGLAAETAAILSRLSAEVPMLFIGMESKAEPIVERTLSGTVLRMELEALDAGEQETLWRAAAAENDIAFAADVSLREIVSKYAMTPGRIASAMAGAALFSTEDGLVSTAVLEDQIRRICSVEFGANATRLSSPFTWDDLMVSDYSAHLLHLACDRVRLRATVLSDFGFAQKLPYGRGVSIALYGPPGTGKTMAAQVLAHELGLAIYRVDLSQISSKYIGETEKNLGSIFDAAKHSNAVLFFDEADALFSKRTEVSSSHDKYANAETSYLLQKIEEYDGVSILATNNLQSFDVAFKRRMTYIIPLEAPDEETRRRLWEKVFPADTPVDARVDFALLAKTLELSGAQIKSIATACAYRAAANGRSVTYDDLIESVDIECQKTGTLQAGERLRQAVMMGG